MTGRDRALSRRLGRGPVRPVLQHPFGWVGNEALCFVSWLLSFLYLWWVIETRLGDDVGWSTAVGITVAFGLPCVWLMLMYSTRLPCTWRWSAHGRADTNAAPGELSVPAWNSGYGRFYTSYRDGRSVGRLTLDRAGVPLGLLRGRGAQRRWEPTGPALAWESITQVRAVRAVKKAPRWWRHPGIEIVSVNNRGWEQYDAIAVALRLTGRDRMGLARELAALMNERADQARPEAWGRYETGVTVDAAGHADQSQRGTP